MKKGKFICIMGIDGSGKTTLVNRTIEIYQTQGTIFKYVWGAYELKLLRPCLLLGKKLLVKNKGSGSNYNAYVAELNTIAGYRGLGRCYCYATISEYLLQIIGKVSIPLLLRKNIISDRYLFDTVISMSVNLNLNQQWREKLLRALLKICPAPDILFFIDVPETVAFARKDDTPSIDYLKKRRELYKDIAAQYNAIPLDGTRKIEQLNDDILAYINRPAANVTKS